MSPPAEDATAEQLAEFGEAWRQLEAFLSAVMLDDPYDRILMRSLRRHYDSAVAARAVNRMTPGVAHGLIEGLRRDVCDGRASVFKLVCALDARLDLQEDLAEVSASAAAALAEPVDNEDDVGVGESAPKKRRIALTCVTDQPQSPQPQSPQRRSPKRQSPRPPQPQARNRPLSADDFDNRVGDDAADLSPGDQRKARALQDCLCRILAKIRRLQRLEMSMEDLDSEGSVYLQEDRLKQRAMQVYTSLCRLRRAPQSMALIAGRFRYRSDNLHPEIGRQIERYVNHRRGFPDLPKVMKIVAWCNRRHRLGWSQAEARRHAEAVFKDVGERLQERRKRDLFDCLFADLPDNGDPDADPAEADPELRRRLERNTSLGNTRMATVMSAYSAMTETTAEADSGSEPSEDEDGGDEVGGGCDAAEKQSTVKADADVDVRANGDAEKDAEADVEAITEADAKAEPDADTEADADAETDAEADAETDAEADAETDAEAEAEKDDDTVQVASPPAPTTPPPPPAPAEDEDSVQIVSQSTPPRPRSPPHHGIHRRKPVVIVDLDSVMSPPPRQQIPKRAPLRPAPVVVDSAAAAGDGKLKLPLRRRLQHQQQQPLQPTVLSAWGVPSAVAAAASLSTSGPRIGAVSSDAAAFWSGARKRQPPDDADSVIQID